MRNRRIERLLFMAALLVSIAPPSASRAEAPPDSNETVLAREEFLKATELTKKAQWAEALAAFERAGKLRPHAITTYNIGACERALGRYTRARGTLRRALAENDAAGGTQLSESLVTEAKAYLAPIEGLLSTVVVTLSPSNAAITVDGRPLEVDSSAASPPVLFAGLVPPGPGRAPPAETFKLVVDPGAHVLTLSRKGFADAVINRTFAPGANPPLKLAIDALPATLHVASDEPGSVVTVSGVDVGVAPVDVSRPAGNYRVVVKKPGHVTYETEVAAHAGEGIDLRATLPVEKRPITSRWWFWTAASVVVSGVAVGTYFVARSEPEPQRPPLDGGALGWTVPLP